MSGKLDQSLDDILQTSRQANRRSSRTSRPANGAKANGRPAAPVGGVKKQTRGPKPAKVASVASVDGDSKVLVSSLPQDVSEKQIQEYFHQTIGNVKKVLLNYGPNGKSRGIATIIFGKVDAAAKAAKAMDGVKVDGRPMKVEVILGAKDAPAPAAPKDLKDRISGAKGANKGQPKPATAPKSAAAKPGKGKKAEKKARPARKPKKTLEELDADMDDYFVDKDAKPAGESDTAMGNGGAVQAPSGGDTGMDDEIM